MLFRSPSGAMDRLGLAAANCLAGNALFAPAIEIGPYGAAFKAREGAVRVAMAGTPRVAEIAGRTVAWDTSVTIADGETLKLGMAQGGAFSKSKRRGLQGEPKDQVLVPRFRGTRSEGSTPHS